MMWFLCRSTSRAIASATCVASCLHQGDVLKSRSARQSDDDLEESIVRVSGNRGRNPGSSFAKFFPAIVGETDYRASGPGRWLLELGQLLAVNGSVNIKTANGSLGSVHAPFSDDVH